VNEIELKKELIQHDMYLLLSIEEGFNNSVVLAQSLGLPCIVSNTGGLPENVIHEQTGLVVAPYNSNEAANAIIMLKNNSGLYEQLSSQAIQKVKQYSLPQQIKEYSDLYHFMTNAH
jgi:glycosyltransferase involved in cell wall biosynthesis